VLNLGLTISISGIVTFRAPRTCRRLLPKCPMSRLLIETDCAVPCAGAASGQSLRAGLRRRYLRLCCRFTRRYERGAGGVDERQLLPSVQPGAPVKLVVLGSGTSTGVPRSATTGAIATREEPRDRRTRVAIVVEGDGGSRLLVDTPTDLRQQLLATRNRRD